jgi:glycerophosphoryl diester phosphodiesterase
VSALRQGDLSAIDAGARFTVDGAYPFRDRSVTIPTLRSVLERYPDTPLLVEIKVALAQRPVREELVRAGAERRTVVAAFDANALAAFRDPPFQAGASRRDIVALKAASLLRLPPANRGVRAYAVPHRYRNRIFVPSQSFIRAAHRLQVPVHVWTVDDPMLAVGLWRSGVSGIITNVPGVMVGALRDLAGGG